MGMRVDVSSKFIIDALQLPLTVEEYMKKIGVLYNKVFALANLLPGTKYVVVFLSFFSASPFISFILLTKLVL